MKRFFLFLIGAVVMPIALQAQTAKTRTELYAEIASNLASGQSMTAAQLRATINNVVASAEIPLTDTAKQPLDSDLTAASVISGAGLVDRVSSTDWQTRSWAYIWTALMTDPAGGTFSYTEAPFTIDNDKRLLGRDSVLPPFTATEISLGTSLAMSSGILDTVQDIRTTAAPTFAGLNVTASQPSAYHGVAITNTASTGYSQLNLAANLASVSKLAQINWAPSLFLKLATPDPTPIVMEVGAATVGQFTTTGFQGAIGATTPSTGAFTSIVVDSGSFASTGVTINGGQVAAARDGNPSLALNRYTSDGDTAEFFRSGVKVGSVSVTTTATAFNTSSDRRLKTNIRDFKGSGAILDAIKPRIFDWKTGEKDAVGFVAQELYEVAPYAVTKGDDGDEVKQQWAVDYSKLVPVLVAEVQALRVRVTTLEASDRRQNNSIVGMLTIGGVVLSVVSVVTIGRRNP